MSFRKTLAAAELIRLSFAWLRAADATDKWTATFNTQVGEQKYIWHFTRGRPQNNAQDG